MADTLKYVFEYLDRLTASPPNHTCPNEGGTTLKVKSCIRRTGVGIITAALAIAFTTLASAGPIPLGTFHEFAFTTAGTPATGCDPADPAGPFCIPSSGTPTNFINAPPWTFLAPVQGAILTVTDAFQAGDRFQVFDFGASIGLTSVPTGNA